MTPSKHQSDYRKRKAAQGLVRVEVWVPEECREGVKTFAFHVTKAHERAQAKDQSDE